MAVEYDLHLYGTPPGGVDLASYWTSPNWWLPLGAQPEYTSATFSTRHEVTAGRRSSRLMDTLLGIFHRQQHHTRAAEERATGGTAPTDPEPDPCPACDVTNDAWMDDLGLALMTLFAEDRGADGAVGEEWRHLAALTDLPCELLMSASDDDVAPSERSRKVKFADDMGLPLTAVSIFEVSDTLEGEEGEEGQDVKGNFRLTKRRRRMGCGATRPVPGSRPAYKRYYKAYTEDYDTRRVQATGAFSMVGF